MNVERVGSDLDSWRFEAFRWRVELAWPAKLGLALAMASVTGLAAQLRVPLPNTPVPLTGQVFTVLLSGVLLGGTWGGVSQLLYVGLGALGVPWFSGWSGGMTLGPTAGYLMGFIVAAALVGYVNDRFVGVRHFGPQIALMALAVAIIYGFAVGFSLFIGLELWPALQTAVFPFVVADAVKVVAAAVAAGVALPKGNFTPDKHRG